jgi:tRNA-dihydrouridine synthase 3
MNEEDAFNESAQGTGSASDIPGESEAMDVPMRPEEKRRLNWDNGIYLAPLTTVGNLVSLVLPYSRKARY